MRSSSSYSTPHAPRVIKSNPFVATLPLSANLETIWEPCQNGCLTQPFRRKRKHKRHVPKCVPPLDLSQFNLSDDHMDPIKLLSATSSLQISWGHVSDTSKQNVHHCAVLSPPTSVIDVTDQLEPGFTEPIIAYQDYKMHQKFGLDLEHGNSKRLRFEARVDTRNGRDIHRELCGFFFLSDGSVAIYELKQFGKKLNTLPLIKRGIYYHCIGARKGKPYEIRHLIKGATLHFLTKSHALSESLAKKELLSVKVSSVDEEIKRELLCEGCNEIQRQEIYKYLSSPLELIGLKEDKLLCTLQGMFCSRLQGRACKVLVGLGRHLAAIAEDGTISFLHLQLSLRKFHISLTSEDMDQFWHLLSISDMFDKCLEGIPLDFCLQALTGGFTEERANLVCQVFKRLDSRKSGQIEVHEMKKFFIHVATTECTSVWSDLITIFNMKDDHTCITFPDFENFHLGVSIEIPSDSLFVASMRAHWQISY